MKLRVAVRMADLLLKLFPRRKRGCCGRRAVYARVTSFAFLESWYLRLMPSLKLRGVELSTYEHTERTGSKQRAKRAVAKPSYTMTTNSF